MVMIHKFFHVLNNHKFEAKFGAFYEGLDTSRKSALYFNMVFMLRRYMYALLILLLPDMPAAQI